MRSPVSPPMWIGRKWMWPQMSVVWSKQVSNELVSEWVGLKLTVSTEMVSINCLYLWFSTFSLVGAKSRLTTLSEGRTKKNYHKSVDAFCFISETKSVAQSVRGFIERLLRAAQRLLGSSMRLSEQWSRTILNMSIAESEPTLQSSSVQHRLGYKHVKEYWRGYETISLVWSGTDSRSAGP